MFVAPPWGPTPPFVAPPVFVAPGPVVHLALVAAQNAFMFNNLVVFDKVKGVSISDNQGVSSIFSPWLQLGAGEMLHPKMLANAGLGDVFVEIGGSDWASSFVVAVYLYWDTMHDEIRFSKIFQVGVSPGAMTECHIAFPRFGGQVLLFFALNARGISAVTNAMNGLGMPVPFMVPAENPTLVQPLPSVLVPPLPALPHQLLVSSTGERKDETRKTAEHKILQLFAYKSTPILHIISGVLVNGEVNSPTFRSRVTGVLDLLPTLNFKGPAFGGFLLSALFLGNFTSSPDVQKACERQSVRLDDLVKDFSPTEGGHLAIPWKHFSSFRHLWKESGTDSVFNENLSFHIQAWIEVLESGGSVGMMNIPFLLFINRRKFAALGVLYQDAASDSMTEEAVERALTDWGTWDRGVLEMESLDWSRNNKRMRDLAEKADKANKKACADATAGRGGRGGLTGRGGNAGGRGRGTSARGLGSQVPVQPASLAVSQHQGPAQGQRVNVCLANVGGLMGIPNSSCSRGNSCKFTHILSLQEIDRTGTEKDVRGILKNSPNLQPFLVAMGLVKFKGE